MDLLKTLAQQFITDTDNDGNIDVTEVIGSLTGLLGGTGGTSQLDLGSIVSKLQGSGLADIATSWLGSGENLPISADQISNIFDSDKLSSFASVLNLDLDSVKSGLSSVIPQLIDKASPSGELLDLSNLDTGGIIDKLKKMF
jgi:uncharacterized protein YidB (DUF937 family)